MDPIFSASGFLDPPSCRRIRQAMDRGTVEPAEILLDTIEPQLDVRCASNIEVEAAVLDEVERRLDAQRGVIAEFFGVALTEREGASFVRYIEGGFYKAHPTRAVVGSWPGAARRQVALVVFLNSGRAAHPSGGFSGGTLRLFVDEEPVDLHPLEGRLVAFTAEVLHEVTAVRDGTRDTIVDWFY